MHIRIECGALFNKVCKYTPTSEMETWPDVLPRDFRDAWATHQTQCLMLTLTMLLCGSSKGSSKMFKQTVAAIFSVKFVPSGPIMLPLFVEHVFFVILSGKQRDVCENPTEDESSWHHRSSYSWFGETGN